MSESTNGVVRTRTIPNRFRKSSVAVDGVGRVPSKPRKPKSRRRSLRRDRFRFVLRRLSRSRLQNASSESVEKPSFETFLSVAGHAGRPSQRQLAMEVLSEEVRDAAMAIIGNLDDDGYLPISLEEIAAERRHMHRRSARGACSSCSRSIPPGVAARDMRECLLIQIESRNGKGGVAWQIVSNHLRLLETRQFKEIAKQLGRPLEHVQIAVNMIRHLDPRPGLRYSGQSARVVEPDVYIIKDGDDYIIQMNDEDVPQLRLNSQYRRMLDRDQEPSKEVRNYVKEKYASALQLMKNIEQRKQTILKVCQSIVRRQRDFLEHGLDELKPMMIKEVAEEIGVHPSTVSRAVASKYAHTPQGVFELAILLLRGRAGSVRRRDAAADPEAQGEEDDRRGGSAAAAHGRTDHCAAAVGRHSSHAPHRRQVSRRHENSVHPPAPRSRINFESTDQRRYHSV